MKSLTHYLWFTTKLRQEIIDITEAVAGQVAKSGVREGLVLVSAMHISASVFVNDHEAGLWQDILTWLESTVTPAATDTTKLVRTTPLPICGASPSDTK